MSQIVWKFGPQLKILDDTYDPAAFPVYVINAMHSSINTGSYHARTLLSMGSRIFQVSFSDLSNMAGNERSW